MTQMAPTIVELVSTCEDLAARNRSLFELLGSWVADEPDPALQQHFAVAAHRHAWHAELWAQRRPSGPHAPTGAAAHLEYLGTERTAWYRECVGDLRAELTALGARTDPLLDPSTQRVIELVLADLDSLAVR